MDRILIVDDDEAIRLLYREELTEEGYRVFTTNRYSELMHVIRESKPDLILFDIRKGKVSDLDVLSPVRKSEPSIPIILCSGCPELPAHSTSGIADSYVGKTSDLNILKEHIREVLRKKVIKYKTLHRAENKPLNFPGQQRVSKQAIKTETRKRSGREVTQQNLSMRGNG